MAEADRMGRELAREQGPELFKQASLAVSALKGLRGAMPTVNKGLTAMSKNPRGVLMGGGAAIGAIGGAMKDPGVDPATGQKKSRLTGALAGAGLGAAAGYGASRIKGVNQAVQGATKNVATSARKGMASTDKWLQGKIGGPAPAASTSGVAAGTKAAPTPAPAPAPATPSPAVQQAAAPAAVPAPTAAPPPAAVPAPTGAPAAAPGGAPAAPAAPPTAAPQAPAAPQPTVEQISAQRQAAADARKAGIKVPEEAIPAAPAPAPQGPMYGKTLDQIRAGQGKKKLATICAQYGVYKTASARLAQFIKMAQAR
jgi:hypothetical protein